ncbi:MAG TPA: hypothetical protein VKA53_02585, partial [Thermoanaerobaculia bacterium]|nr:hypothetical protein [Thermoanaerobaculia bacterium]
SFFYLGNDNLTFGSKRRTWVPTAVPNPLLLVYSFLEPESLTYRERMNLATIDWLKEPKAWSDFAAEAIKQGNHPDASHWEVTLSRDGHPITVELRSDPTAGLVVERISKRSPGNDGTSVISMKDYVKVPTKEGDGIVAIPRTVALSYQSNGGAKPVQSFDYQLTLITVDHPIPDSVFVLKPKPGAHLWSEDQRKFVKKAPTQR